MSHNNGGGPNWPTKAVREHRRRRNASQRGAQAPGPLVYGDVRVQRDILRAIVPELGPYRVITPPPPPPVIDTARRPRMDQL